MPLRIFLRLYCSPGSILEQRADQLGLDRGVSADLELADRVAGALVNRHAQAHPARVALPAVLDELDLRQPDLDAGVALVLVELRDALGVLGVLRLLVRAAVGDEREPVARLVLLHLAAERAVADHGVAVEHDLPQLDLGPVIDLERHAHQLRAPRFGDLGLDDRVVVALLGVQIADDALDAPDGGLVDERVDLDLDALFTELLVDRRVIDLELLLPAGRDEVHHLDARSLFEVKDDVLARDAVVVGLVDHLDPEVLQEVRAPEIPEVVLDRRFGVGRPHGDGPVREGQRRRDAGRERLERNHSVVGRVALDLDAANQRRGAGRGQVVLRPDDLAGLHLSVGRVSLAQEGEARESTDGNNAEVLQHVNPLVAHVGAWRPRPPDWGAEGARPPRTRGRFVRRSRPDGGRPRPDRRSARRASRGPCKSRRRPSAGCRG